MKNYGHLIIIQHTDINNCGTGWNTERLSVQHSITDWEYIDTGIFERAAYANNTPSGDGVYPTSGDGR
jgi:hypothetical protein